MCVCGVEIAKNEGLVNNFFSRLCVSVYFYFSINYHYKYKNKNKIYIRNLFEFHNFNNNKFSLDIIHTNTHTRTKCLYLNKFIQTFLICFFWLKKLSLQSNLNNNKKKKLNSDKIIIYR